MPEPAKLKRLREMRAKLSAGKFREDDLKKLHFADTDGRMVRLGDEDALAALDRRIAAEEAG